MTRVQSIVLIIVATIIFVRTVMEEEGVHQDHLLVQATLHHLAEVHLPLRTIGIKVNLVLGMKEVVMSEARTIQRVEMRAHLDLQTRSKEYPSQDRATVVEGLGLRPMLDLKSLP